MMASGKHILPNTMIAPDTGELLTRGVRPFVVSYKGESVTVELPGYYPAGAGDGVHVGDDVSVVDEALRGLEKKSRACPLPHDEREAGLLLAVGENALDTGGRLAPGVATMYAKCTPSTDPAKADIGHFKGLGLTRGSNPSCGTNKFKRLQAKRRSRALASP
jgi:HTH-type transcriptional regulator / antitoxin MqsA